MFVNGLDVVGMGLVVGSTQAMEMARLAAMLIPTTVRLSSSKITGKTWWCFARQLRSY